MSFCVFIGNDLPYFTLCDFLAIDHLFSSRPHDLKIYDVERLKWNTAYNARAGAEIVLHYLQQYGIAEEKQTGNLDNAARATYAVYNAGPKAVTRYRARNSSGREKKAIPVSGSCTAGLLPTERWICPCAPLREAGK